MSGLLFKNMIMRAGPASVHGASINVVALSHFRNVHYVVALLPRCANTIILFTYSSLLYYPHLKYLSTL